MRTLAVLLEKEFRQFFRNPFLPRMALMFPVMVMLVMPWVTTMDIRHVSVSVVDCDRSPASRRIVQKIGASDYFTLCGVSDDFAVSKPGIPMPCWRFRAISGAASKRTHRGA